MTFNKGDDVIVDFKGIDHQAEVVEVANHTDYVLVRMHIDPEADYGNVTASLPPEAIVWTKREQLRPAHGVG